MIVSNTVNVCSKRKSSIFSRFWFMRRQFWGEGHVCEDHIGKDHVGKDHVSENHVDEDHVKEDLVSKVARFMSARITSVRITLARISLARITSASITSVRITLARITSARIPSARITSVRLKMRLQRAYYRLPCLDTSGARDYQFIIGIKTRAGRHVTLCGPREVSPPIEGLALASCPRLTRIIYVASMVLSATS